MGFRKSKRVSTPTTSPFGGFSGRARAMFAEQQAREAAERQAREREQRIGQGRGYIDGAFGQFDDGYFNNLRQNYSGFYDQSVQDDYMRRRNELANQFGQTQGSQAFDYVNLFDSLDREYANTRSQAGSAADGYVSGVRNEVASNRNSLYSQNDQVADPNAISQSAKNAASSIRNRQFSPLGSFFANIKPLTGTSTAPSQGGGAVNYGSFANADSQFNPAAFNIAPVSSSRVVS